MKLPGKDTTVEASYCSNSQALISLALPRGRGMHRSGKRGEGDRSQPPPCDRRPKPTSRFGSGQCRLQI